MLAFLSYTSRSLYSSIASQTFEAELMLISNRMSKVLVGDTSMGPGRFDAKDLNGFCTRQKSVNQRA